MLRFKGNSKQDHIHLHIKLSSQVEHKRYNKTFNGQKCEDSFLEEYAELKRQYWGGYYRK